jgi:hypothetical protein
MTIVAEVVNDLSPLPQNLPVEDEDGNPVRFQAGRNRVVVMKDERPGMEARTNFSRTDDPGAFAHEKSAARKEAHEENKAERKAERDERKANKEEDPLDEGENLKTTQKKS